MNPLLWGKQADFAPPTSLALDFAVSTDAEQVSEQQDNFNKSLEVADIELVTLQLRADDAKHSTTTTAHPLP